MSTPLGCAHFPKIYWILISLGSKAEKWRFPPLFHEWFCFSVFLTFSSLMCSGKKMTAKVFIISFIRTPVTLYSHLWTPKLKQSFHKMLALGICIFSRFPLSPLSPLLGVEMLPKGLTYEMVGLRKHYPLPTVSWRASDVLWRTGTKDASVLLCICKSNTGSASPTMYISRQRLETGMLWVSYSTSWTLEFL